MPNQSRFPVTDADFSNHINIVIPYLGSVKGRLVTTAAAQSALTTVTSALTNATTGWNYTYQMWLNPTTSTTTFTTNKNLLRESIEAELRLIFADIPQSILTQTDRDTLNLPLRADTYTPSSVPTAIPSVLVRDRAHLSVTLSIVDVAHPQSKAKPEGVDSIEIEAAFLPADTTPPAGFPKDTDFRHVAMSGKATYNRSYSSEQLKGTEYIKARYLNSRNQPGGWSEVISVIVS